MHDEINYNYVSDSIEDAFEAVGLTVEGLDFKYIYSKILNVLPPRNSSFCELSLECAIGAEVVCAAICHQINWDFLRSVIYKKTIDNSKWLTPYNLSKITAFDVALLISSYDKPERIREAERSSLLRSVGKSLVDINYNYTEIFLSDYNTLKNPDEIYGCLNSSIAFSRDPEGKKAQLLLQNLTEYPELSGLSTYCKPAIDYHIIREFLRRGLVRPKNQIGLDYIFKPAVKRQEQTVAAIRRVCSEALYELVWLTSLDVVTLNTIEWWIGRSVCIKEHPDCYLGGETSQWLKPSFSKCPFFDSCYAVKYDTRYLNIVEPTYTGSSY
jgi:hypothetical protein